MKFVLDNNLSPHYAEALRALLTAARSPHSVVALRAELPQETLDPDWIRHYGELGDCCVVSGDKRLLSRPHERLALQRHRLTYVVLAPGWSNLNLWEKSWLLIRWWPVIEETASHASAGSGFVVPYKHAPKALKPLRL